MFCVFEKVDGKNNFIARGKSFLMFIDSAGLGKLFDYFILVFVFVKKS